MDPVRYKVVRVYDSPHYAPTTQLVGDLEPVKAHCEGPRGSSQSLHPRDRRHTQHYGSWHDIYEPFFPRLTPEDDLHADLFP